MMLDVFTSSVMMTNSIVLRSGDDAILVDPAWTTGELGRLAEHLDGVNIVCGWATHAHHDHVLWHPGFGSAPRYATPRAARRALERQPSLEQAATAHVAWELIPLVARVEVFNGATLPWDGPDVEIIVHNAHSPGHGALWIPSTSTLIAGDMLSDVEIPTFTESGWEAYTEGLLKLEPYVREAKEVIPGHGRSTSRSRQILGGAETVGPRHGSPALLSDPVARWEADMAYLELTRTGHGHEDARLTHGPVWLWDAHHENVRVAVAA